MALLLRAQSAGLAAVALGISVFLSRILGLVRDKIISYYFGSGMESDVYFTAFVVPDFISYLLAGGYFSITLVPLLSRRFLEDEDDAWRFFSAAVCWATLAISLFCLLGWLFAPQLAKLVAPGFSGEKSLLLARYLRIILPAQIFFLPGACFTAVLYCRKQFTVPALTPLFYNGAIILGGLAGLAIAPEQGMEGFCWGVLAGAFAGSFALPLWAVRAGGLRFAPRLAHPMMKTVLKLALPLMLGQSIVSLDEQFIRIFGSLAHEGSVSLLSYARRIMLVPVGVIAQAAGLASFPFLAGLVAKGDKRGFEASLNTTLQNALLVAFPVSLWMMVAAEPIMRLVFQQGSFTPQAAAQSGLLLAVMMASVVFWTIQQIMGRAYYACQDTLTPALLGTLATVVTLGAYYYGAISLGPLGIAFAGAFGVALYTGLLCVVWWRRHGAGALSGVATLAFIALCLCIPAKLAAGLTGRLLQSLFPEYSLAGAFVFICASGVVFCAVYLGLAQLLRPDLLAPLHALLNRLKKK